MNPTMMLTLLVAAWAAFAWSINRRWQLLKVGRSEKRNDHIGTRLKVLYEYALVQKKMGYYPLAGLAHKVIFLGFSLLLLRTLILWGRGFDRVQFLDLRRLSGLPLAGAVPSDRPTSFSRTSLPSSFWRHRGVFYYRVTPEADVASPRVIPGIIAS